MSKAVFAVVLALILMACQKSPPQSPEPPNAAARQKITVSYTVQPQSTLVHVAVAKGYFVAEGLAVQSLLHTFGKASLQSLLDHQSDFATVAETPVMFNVLKGEKISVIANIEASTTNNAIVARRDAGIAQPQDLKGKRIGYTPGTTSDFFLDSLLTAQGLTRGDIQAVALKPEEMSAAMTAKTVAAVSTWNYPLTQIKHLLGTNGVLFVDREIYTETYNVVAQQNFVRDHPETVKRFLRALLKAEDFVASHKEEAQAIMSAATKIDIDLIREVWDSFNYRVALNQALLITLEDETRWAMRNKLTEQTAMPNYSDYIHVDSLKAVKPEAVMMNR